MIANCNRCNRGICQDARKMRIGDSCKRFKPPYDTWKLAELVLVNPSGLNEVLSGLPLHTGIDIYLEGGK